MSSTVMVALRKVWAVMDVPAGKRMTPSWPRSWAGLRACGEDLDDEKAAKMSAM